MNLPKKITPVGKGSARRIGANDKLYAAGYERIFGKRKKTAKKERRK